MDTRFLDSFIAFVESGSLAEAARRSNITPAALALRIQTLESELGVELVVRSGRKVNPTAAGIAFAARAGGIVRELRDLTLAARDSRLTGRLRIGVALSAIPGLLCRVLPRFVERHPNVEVSMVKGYSAEVYRKLTGSDVDAAIVFLSGLDIPKTYDWIALREEPYIVLAPGHLAEADPHEVLRAEPFVRYDRSLWSGQLADRYLRRVRIRPQERIELDSLAAIAVLVDQGLGVSLVPDWLPPWPEGLSVAKLPLPSPRPARHLGLVWPRTSPCLPHIHVLRELAMAALRSSDGQRPGAPVV